MAGRACVFVGRAAFVALDKLTKNTLIDLVADLARGELGEEASDEAVLTWIQGKLSAVNAQRKQPFVNLLAIAKRVENASEKYRAEHQA